MSQGTNHKEPSTRHDNEVLVKVEGVSKIFCRDLKKSLLYGLKDSARDLFSWGRKIEDGRSWIVDEEQDPRKALSDHPEFKIQNPKSAPHAQANDDDLRPGEFYAVRDVSFELKRGECLGLIGRNGAGKTTLLKMLNGLIKPDSGRIEMRGRIGALIALGAGFNPILSGRENIYINGSILGLSKKEIDEKVDEIIEFAEIGDFIDSPVQSYSSGMQVRLGFAVATALEPDVLILDEVLAVGDASFRHKCYHRLNKLIKNCAVILVSHSMDYISTVSTLVGMMQRGAFKSYLDINEGIAAYEEANKDIPGQDEDGGKVLAFYPPVARAVVTIVSPTIAYGESLDIAIELHCTEPISNAEISFSAMNLNEQHVMASSTSRLDNEIDIPKGASDLNMRISPLLLHDGEYRWNFSIRRKGSIEHLIWAMRAGKFTVQSTHAGASSIPYLPMPQISIMIQRAETIADEFKAV